MEQINWVHRCMIVTCIIFITGCSSIRCNSPTVIDRDTDIGLAKEVNRQ